jgi:hypothetical protein
MSTPAGNVDGRAESDGPSPSAGQPVLDVFAVLAAMQQQLDDLRHVAQAQQRTLQVLLAHEPAGAAAAAGSPIRGSR